MLRLPPFTYLKPTTAEDAVRMAADAGPDAMFVAGGTDLWPNMKRRHQEPKTVISLAEVRELHATSGSPEQGLDIGAMVTLTSLEHDEVLRKHYPALAHAAREISTPLLRNTGTIGGNLLLDTRCTYYDQTFEWRESISFCMKKEGAICWVAPGSPRCWAVQSSDSVPPLVAMDAEATLVGPKGTRRVHLEELYQDDGIEYLTKAKDELLTQLHLPAVGRWRASYAKLRRRNTFDFPVLGIGAAVWFEDDDKTIAKARIRIGGAGSYPIPADKAEELLIGKTLDDEDAVAAAAQAAFKPTRPMDNTDHEVAWRKKMAPAFVRKALAELL